MKKFLLLICITFIISAFLFSLSFAGETGHYVSGVEGIKAATLPPPGFYWRAYNVFYNAETLTDENGNKIDIGFDISLYALVNRLVWVSNKEILGANYVADVIIPLIYTDIAIDTVGVDSDEFDLGDLCVEPFVLSWHGLFYDASVGLALYMPTGSYEKNKPSSPGKDFWTIMFTFGGTYYFDKEKTWSISNLARYEIHTEKDKTEVRLGNDFHFEWGIGKKLTNLWEAGLTGYCHWQVTDDSGSDVTWDRDVHDKVFAIGPEINFSIPSFKLGVSLRTQWEFEAKDRPEGNITSLTLTKIF